MREDTRHPATLSGFAAAWLRPILIVLSSMAALGLPAFAAPDDATLIKATEARYNHLLAAGQYMKQSCSDTTLSEWPGVPLKRCRYGELGARAEVTLALPSATQLARWTVTACRDAGASDMAGCTQHLANRIWSASNAQLPVRGYVIEPKSVLGGSSNAPYCFLFRDGVTVRTATVSSRPPQGGQCAPQSAESDPITKAFSFARIASTSRDEFALAPGAPSLSALAGLAFPDAVRKEVAAAWGSDRNRLISGAAIADKGAGKFH